MTSKFLAIWLGVMAALQFVASAGNLSDLLPEPGATWFQLLVGALQAFSAVVVGKSAVTAADGYMRKRRIAGQDASRHTRV
jgi:hypothetical protein